MLSHATSSDSAGEGFIEGFNAKIEEILADIKQYQVERRRIDSIKWEPKQIKRENGGYALNNSDSPDMLKLIPTRDIQYKIDVFAHYAERYYDPSKAGNEQSIKPKESRSVLVDMSPFLGSISSDNQSLASLIDTAMNAMHPTTREEVLTICNFAHENPQLLIMLAWLQKNDLATEKNFKKLKAYEGDDVEFFSQVFNASSTQQDKQKLQLLFDKFFQNKTYSQNQNEMVIADNFSLSACSQNQGQLFTIKDLDLKNVLQIYSKLNAVDQKIVTHGNPVHFYSDATDEEKSEKKSFSLINQEILASLQKSLQQPLRPSAGQRYEKLYRDASEKVTVLTSTQMCMVARILYRAMIPGSSSIELVEQGDSDLAGGKSLEKYNDEVNSKAALILSQQLFGEIRANALIKFWKFSLIFSNGFTPQTLGLFFSMPEKHAYDFVAVLTELHVDDYVKRVIQYHYPAYSMLMFETLNLMKNYMLAHEPIQTEANYEELLNGYSHKQHAQHNENPLLINRVKAFLFLAKAGLWTPHNRDLLFSHKRNACSFSFFTLEPIN